MAAEVTFYGSYLSGPTYKVGLMLRLCGVAYDYRHVDLAKGAQKTPEFLAINRYGQVPAIVHQGQGFCQSNSILTYLSETFGKYGAAGALRWRAHEWLQWEADKLMPGIARTRFFTKFVKAEPAVAENFRKSAEGALNQLNGLLGASDFALGASPSLVDVALYATVWQTEDGKIDISGLANILAWKKRVEALPGFGMPRDVLFKEDHDA